MVGVDRLLHSISISTILESESNVNSQFNYLVDNYLTNPLPVRKSRRAIPARELMTQFQLDLDLYTNGVWEFQPISILYITTMIMHITTIFSGISNPIQSFILPSLSSLAATQLHLFYHAAGALSTSRATIYRRNQPFTLAKILREAGSRPG